MEFLHITIPSTSDMSVQTQPLCLPYLHTYFYENPSGKSCSKQSRGPSGQPPRKSPLFLITWFALLLLVLLFGLWVMGAQPLASSGLFTQCHSLRFRQQFQPLGAGPCRIHVRERIRTLILSSVGPTFISHPFKVCCILYSDGGRKRSVSNAPVLG